MNIRWYLSPAGTQWGRLEIVWRARYAETAFSGLGTLEGTSRAGAPLVDPLSARTYPLHLDDGGAPMERIPVFDLEFPLGFEFDWHRDYRYGHQVEPGFAGALNIRDTTVVSDIKYVWEPSRHQYLSALAFAANGEQHADYIVRSIDSWLRANPYLHGVHWTSSLELAERILSWALLYPRIADQVARDEDFRRRWLDSIYLHLTRIAGKLSLYSSANNHLLGELVGLFVGSSCFDFWPECSGWRSLSQKLLEREILLQVGEDGVNREQAMSYHLFTMELFLLAFAIGRNTGAAVQCGICETGCARWPAFSIQSLHRAEICLGMATPMMRAGLWYQKKAAGSKLPCNWLGCSLLSRAGCASAPRLRRRRERWFRICWEVSITA